MRTSKEDIQERLIAYIEEKCLVKFDGEKLSIQTNLFDANVLDSYEVIELIVFMESEFGIHFSDADLLSPALNSISNMAEFVQASRSAS